MREYSFHKSLHCANQFSRKANVPGKAFGCEAIAPSDAQFVCYHRYQHSDSYWQVQPGSANLWLLTLWSSFASGQVRPWCVFGIFRELFFLSVQPCQALLIAHAIIACSMCCHWGITWCHGNAQRRWEAQNVCMYPADRKVCDKWQWRHLQSCLY